MDGYLSSTWLWSHFTSSGSATSILFSRNSTVYFCFYRTWYVYTDAHRIVQMRKQHSDIQGIEPHYQRELAYPVDVNKTLRMFKGISHHHCVVSQWIVKINGIILLWYLIIIQYRTWRISPHCFCAIHQTSTQEFGPLRGLIDTLCQLRVTALTFSSSFRRDCHQVHTSAQLFPFVGEIVKVTSHQTVNTNPFPPGFEFWGWSLKGNWNHCCSYWGSLNWDSIDRPITGVSLFWDVIYLDIQPIASQKTQKSFWLSCDFDAPYLYHQVIDGTLPEHRFFLLGWASFTYSADQASLVVVESFIAPRVGSGLLPKLFVFFHQHVVAGGVRGQLV